MSKFLALSKELHISLMSGGTATERGGCEIMFLLLVLNPHESLVQVTRLPRLLLVKNGYELRVSLVQRGSRSDGRGVSKLRLVYIVWLLVRNSKIDR
ncbi:hypothetical protein E2C01_101792 [Portunus trituberculatus]|uniref:Uncharacterized protein n=1 Tax=Portunus trituberculatus TaxID=210409 RepID=A0A5B7KGR6_PORTR|nr:hypothetical protein [Portunus trituberculatus]